MIRKTNTERIEDLESKLNDSNSKIERLLIENSKKSTGWIKFGKARVVLELIVIVIIGPFLAFKANELVDKANSIMNISNNIQKDGTERSLKIMSETNEISKNGTKIMAHSDSLMSHSILIMENSNRLVELGNKLEESSRKSAMIPIIESTIDKLNDESLLPNSNNQDSELSESLIESICSHTQLLTPYFVLEDEYKNEAYMSPGRGRLLRSLLSVRVDEKSLKSIFKQSNFAFSDLRQISRESITLLDAKLSHSYFSGATINNSKISNTDFNYSDLNDAKFEWCIFNNQTTFNNIKMDNVSFKGCKIEENVEFINTTFRNVNLENTKFKNIKTYRLLGPSFNCSLSCTEFENVIFDNAVFKNCRWEGTKFIDCALGLSNLNINDIDTFKDQFKSNIKGLRGISRANCDNVKVKLYQTTLSPNNSLLLNSHFREYHTIKDTVVSNRKLVVANYKGVK